MDFRNADVLLIIGNNTAVNHPVSMKWVMQGKEKGAKLIVADPRFTRSAAMADIYAPFRSGTDIAFMGGMINYILGNSLYFKEYVVRYTNAAFLVNPEFKGPGELDGVFSGYDEKTRKYDRKTWSFQTDEKGVAKKDPTLEDPNCVFQLLRKHFSRYTLDKASSITGTPKEKLEEVYRTFAATGKPDKAGTILYSMGATQHSTGAGNVMSYSIVQLLLGNVGMAGGGLNAMRGEGNAQGSPDNGILFEHLPGYNLTPTASLVDLKTYIKKHSPETKDPKSVNWWINRDKYIVSYLKSIYGDKATNDNDFGYSWIPKRDEGMSCSDHMAFDEMFNGKIEGYFSWAMNRAVSAANAGKVRKAFSKLQWMVSVDLFDNETASFWRGPGMKPEEIKTEVFLLPAASFLEEEGSTTNTGRWLQWNYKVVEPIGGSKTDYEITNELYFRVKRLYEKEGGAFPEPIVNLTWNYGEKGPDGKIKNIDIHAVAKEINGYYLEDLYDKTTTPPKLLGKKGDLVANFTHLQADGTTSSGNWLYCDFYTQKDGKVINKAARRGHADPTGLGLFSEWGWSWPLNRRILYNRASVDPEGNPWDPKRAVIKWDAAASKWIGDVPDGGPPPLAHEKGRLPFIMKDDGVGHIFGPLAEGPFPEHYEPLECPLQENPMSKQRINPTSRLFYDNGRGLPEDIFLSCDTRYPYVATIFRTLEHYQSGSLTRRQPWLLECSPQMFVEMSKELAKEKGIENGEKVIVSSARAKLWAIAMVTSRLKPFKIEGSTVHQIGLPLHYGWMYPENGGDSANLLGPWFFDPNVGAPETKAFMVNISKILK